MALSCPAGVRTTNITHKSDLQLSPIHRKACDCRLHPGFPKFRKGSTFSKKYVCLSSDKIGTGKRVAGNVQAAAGLQSTDVSDKVGNDYESQFSEIEVVSTSGERVILPELWSKRLVVVAWARHFGCLLCKKRAAEMTKRKAEFEAQGAQLVIIGPGSQSQAKAFLEQTGFAGEVYADPTSASFDKLGFVFGPGSIFTPKALANLVGASMEGFKQDWGLSFQRDTVVRGGWQQGGVMVAGPGVDNVRFLHKDKEAGDEPDWSEVVRACSSAKHP